MCIMDRCTVCVEDFPQFGWPLYPGCQYSRFDCTCNIQEERLISLTPFFSGQPPHWTRLTKQDISNVQVECQDRCFRLQTIHFTSFSITLCGTETLAKEIMFLPYGKEVSSFETDQEIRIYMYDYYSSNREVRNCIPILEIEPQ